MSRTVSKAAWIVLTALLFVTLVMLPACTTPASGGSGGAGGAGGGGDKGQSYTLTITSTTGGSVTMPGEGTLSYDGGMAVNLVATPGSGYQFVNWTGNVQTIANVNAASTAITMNDDYSVVANFKAIPPVQYTLTISSTQGGSVSTPGQGTFRYAAGVVVDLVAESDEGYKFFKWTGDTEMIADLNPAPPSTAHCQPPRHFSITMDGNHAITANFIPRWFIPTG